MILETIPEIRRLSPQDRLRLATELLEEFKEAETPELDEAISALIQERMEYFRKHPESARSWEEIRRGIGKT